MFPRFPFFYWSTLDNTEIRLGPNLYERRGKHNYWNRILFSFVWLFRSYNCQSTHFLQEKLDFQNSWWKIRNFGYSDRQILFYWLLWLTKSLLLVSKNLSICPSDVDKFLVTSNKEFVRQTRFVLLKLQRKTKIYVHLSYVEKAITNEKILFNFLLNHDTLSIFKAHLNGKIFLNDQKYFSIRGVSKTFFH